MFGRDVEAIGAVIVRPIVNRNRVSDVEIGSGTFPIGQPSLPVVEVEDVFAFPKFGLEGCGANSGGTADVNVLRFLIRLYLKIVFTEFRRSTESRGVGSTEESRIQLNIDRRSVECGESERERERVLDCNSDVKKSGTGIKSVMFIYRPFLNQ